MPSPHSFDRSQPGVRVLQRDFRLPLMLLALLTFTVAVVWRVKIVESQLVQSNAITAARKHVEALELFRDVYTSEVIDKVRGHGIQVSHNYVELEGAIPLPSTLSILLGERLAETGDKGNSRLYSDYPFAGRAESGGVRDDFEREALKALRLDPKTEFYKFEEHNGQASIRYAAADIMFPACVKCHNTHPDSPKRDWMVGDVRGVLEVRVPLDHAVLRAQSSLSPVWWLIWIGAALSLALISLLARSNSRRLQTLSAWAENQERLASSERAKGVILNCVTDAIIAMDSEGFITEYNRAAEVMLGYKRENVLGLLVQDVLVPPAYREAHTQGLRRYNETGASNILGKDLELSALCADGSEIPVEISFGVLEESSGPTFTASLRNIADRVHARELLTNAMEDAVEASEAKSDFLAKMSHEIRTPMNGLLGFAEELENESLPEDARRESIALIRSSGEHLLQIINDILDISKIEAGKLDLEFLQISPAKLISEAVSTYRSLANDKDLVLDVQWEGPIPEHVRTDPTRLHQVLLNLLSNAIKFTEKGGVKVLSRMDMDAEDGPKLEIEVSDTGIGLSPEQSARVFDSFVQADNSTTRRFGGTGLGLPISQQLAEMLGGGIELTSELGSGSTFRVNIDTGPLEGVQLLEGEALRNTLSEPDSPRSEQLRLSQRLLVAEDNAVNQLLVRRILEGAGAKVDIVENGREAIEYIDAATKAQAPYGLILMDMQMPVLDGYAATRELRTTGYTGKIMALTANAMLEDRARCMAAGCDDVVSKPINRTELLQAILYLSDDSSPSPGDSAS